MNTKTETIERVRIEVYGYDINEALKYINDGSFEITLMDAIRDGRSQKYTGKFFIVAEREAKSNVNVSQEFGNVAAGSKITGVSIGRIG